jgi:hypothetical protein
VKKGRTKSSSLLFLRLHHPTVTPSLANIEALTAVLDEEAENGNRKRSKEA